MLSWLRRLFAAPSADALRAVFVVNRPRLFAEFLAAAVATGKPRGLRWLTPEWDDGVTLVREVKAGATLAFVGMVISFEAVEGSDMEDVEAVGHARHGTAVFVLHRGAWVTQGRVLFNLRPADVLERFPDQFRPLES